VGPLPFILDSKAIDGPSAAYKVEANFPWPLIVDGLWSVSGQNANPVHKRSV